MQLFSQTKSAKILWFCIVCLGFIGAAILIGKSYKEWQDHPIATSITTHPIDNLEFPQVTICPPRDSNTALYHDLVKAGNGTLFEDYRKTLRKTAFEIFIEQTQKEYTKTMLAISNIGNMNEVFQGFHSLPKPNKGSNGLEIRMWNMNGTITTPWFGGDFVEEYYQQDREFAMVLKLPNDINDQVGGGSLIIDLEIDTREETWWVEEVSLMPYFTLHTAQKYWSEAESHCQGEGGHLASVTSGEVAQAVMDVAGNKYNEVWLGGRRVLGEWTWSDNSIWSYDSWYLVTSGNCLYSERGMWYKSPCSERRNFICQKPNVLKGEAKISLAYRRDEFSAFLVGYKYKAANQHLLDSWKDKRMTGLRLNWFLKDSNGTKKTEVLPARQGDWRQEGQVPILGYKKQPLLHDMVQLARELRLQNMTKEEILEEVIHQKSQKRIIPEVDDICLMGQIKEQEQKGIFSKLVFNASKSQTSGDPSDEDIETGHELFHAVVFCPANLFKMYTFIDQLLSNETSRTIIQTIVHLLQPSAITDKASLTSVKQFYHVFASTLDLQYGNILLATSTSAQLQDMMTDDLPFFTNNTNLVKRCLQDQEPNCDFVRDIYQILGKPKKVVSLFCTEGAFRRPMASHPSHPQSL